MPPRSVCLNVFTTSLGSGIPKEANVSAREFGSHDGAVKEKEGPVTERGRHDSVQGSPNDTIGTPPYTDSTNTSAHASPIATSEIDVSSFPDGIGVFSRPVVGANLSAANPMTATPLCSTCGQLPASGSSLQRCSRCKSAYYCSKACQKAAWKLHKLDCRGGSSSALATPNISMPGSPTNGVSEVTYREGSFDVAIAGVEGEKDGEMEGVEVQG